MSRSEIVRVFEIFEADEPDASTERLLAMTADYCKCDVDDVCEALLAAALRKEP